jgi:hypothetical protein
MVVGANIEVGLMVNGSNYYLLYQNSHVVDIHVVEDQEWVDNNFSYISALRNLDRD